MAWSLVSTLVPRQPVLGRSPPGDCPVVLVPGVALLGPCGGFAAIHQHTSIPASLFPGEVETRANPHSTFHYGPLLHRGGRGGGGRERRGKSSESTRVLRVYFQARVHLFVNGLVNVYKVPLFLLRCSREKGWPLGAAGAGLPPPQMLLAGTEKSPLFPNRFPWTI